MPGGLVTEPTHIDLMTLATPYALHAVTPAEFDEIERQLATAPELVARAFAEEVRAVRETMATLSASTAIEPPEHLRGRLLASVEQHPLQAVPPQAPPGPAPVAPPRQKTPARWRNAVLAAAAAVLIGVGALGLGWTLRPVPKTSTAEMIFAAPDVRTVSGDIPTGGTATVVFSRDRNAAVLVMNGVAPPEAGTVYQMWLVGNDGARSAGTMDAKAVAPSTTAVLPDLGSSKALAFTVEPGNGSVQPTTPVFAELPLV
jgi:Anti-sigma-K factor rskA